MQSDQIAYSFITHHDARPCRWKQMKSAFHAFRDALTGCQKSYQSRIKIFLIPFSLYTVLRYAAATAALFYLMKRVRTVVTCCDGQCTNIEAEAHRLLWFSVMPWRSGNKGYQQSARSSNGENRSYLTIAKAFAIRPSATARHVSMTPPNDSLAQRAVCSLT